VDTEIRELQQHHMTVIIAILIIKSLLSKCNSIMSTNGHDLLVTTPMPYPLHCHKTTTNSNNHNHIYIAPLRRGFRGATDDNAGDTSRTNYKPFGTSFGRQLAKMPKCSLPASACSCIPRPSTSFSRSICDRLFVSWLKMHKTSPSYK